MADGPNAHGKQSKYSVEDGKMVRKGEFCPNCGTALEANDNFCQDCGIAI